MTPIPLLLHETLTHLGREAVDTWWAQLEEPERRGVIELWQSASEGQACEARVAVDPVGAEEPAGRSGLWHSDFYEHLVNHEVYIERDRPFHICTRHAAAKAVVQAGLIPAGFACPLAERDCPMQRLLREFPKKSLRLSVALTPGNTPALTVTRL